MASKAVADLLDCRLLVNALEQRQSWLTRKIEADTAVSFLLINKYEKLP